MFVEFVFEVFWVVWLVFQCLELCFVESVVVGYVWMVEVSRGIE